eukprot:175602-Heterocapsa_arctica.AAC.1
MQILRTAIVHYRAPRFVTMEGFVCPGQAPRRGIIAGCSAATTLVKVYTVMECDSVVQKHPEVGFDFFVDDWQGAAVGGHNWVKHQLADAATSLRLAIEGNLECKVAVDKAAVVASSRELAD